MSKVEIWAERTASLHHVLANPRRLIILRALEQQELSVGKLAKAIGASLQSTSQHLRLMREHGILRARRQGQAIYYHMEGPACRIVKAWLETSTLNTGQASKLRSSKIIDEGDRS